MYTTELKNKIKIISTNYNSCSAFRKNNCGIGLTSDSFELTTFEWDTEYNIKFDIFIIHSYNFGILEDRINTKTIKCKKLVIDTRGEWASTDRISELKYNIKNLGIIADEKIIFGIIDKKSDIEIDGWTLIRTEFSPSFFVNFQNGTFSYIGKIGDGTYKPAKVCGTKKVESKKQYSFMCLNNGMRPHRIVFCKTMVDKNITDLGLVSFRNVDVTTDDFDIYTDGSETGGMENKRFKFSELKIKGDKVNLDGDIAEKRFNMQSWITDNAYIDVVTETQTGFDDHEKGSEFVTEKSVKPFLSLQFPIILGYPGIYDYLRDYGFDMFDDIIDNSHDKIDIRDGKLKNLEDKCNMIVDEIIRLSKLDLHELYEKHFDRLLSNQKLLNKYQDNWLYTKEVLYPMFGDNIKSIERTNLIEEHYV